MPNTWREYELSQLCTKLVVGFVGTCEDFYTDGSSGVMMLRTGDIKGTRIDFSNAKYISDDFHERNKKSQLKCGDVLIARHGSSGHGVVFDSNKPANALNIVILRTNDTLILSKYLVQLLDSQEIQKQVVEASAGSTQNVINTSQIAKISICIPCVSEQRKIVDICESIDSLLENLEKQISKKRAIKQGAMQELLTGKKRLPGFSDEWEKHSFYGVCDISARMVDPTQSEYENYPHIGNESIEKFSGRITHYNKVKEDQLISGKYIFTENDVLYGKINPQFAKATFPRFKGLCSADMYPITCKDQIIPEYLLYILLSSDFTSYTVSLSKRSGIPKVNRDELAEYPMLLPSVEEQRAISDVLIGMDAEIEMLIQKLRRYRQVKQGMMQQLLTGKIRLTEDR